MTTFSEAVAGGPITTEQAWAIYDELEPVTEDELLGLWKGSSFATESPQDGFLEKSGWFGKHFVSRDEVHPLVFNSNDGGTFNVQPAKAKALASQGAFLPDRRSEVETEDAKARIRVVVHRGVPTASMVYNEEPIIDHFRKVDSDTLLGVMDNISMPGPPFFFFLRRNGN